MPEKTAPGPLDLPFEHVAVSGAEALERLAALRKEETDRTPVLLGDDEEADFLPENWEMRDLCKWGSPDEIIAASNEIDVHSLFEQRIEKEELQDVEIGDWPEDADTPKFEIDLHEKLVWKDSILPWRSHYIREPKERIYIGLVPTTRSWETAAHLCIGNWNACPTPMAHVAIARYWNNEYGAQTVAMEHDTVCFEVERRPATREQAMTLAWQHYAYCNDTVDQGTETLSKLAAGLMNSDFWTFWWD